MEQPRYQKAWRRAVLDMRIPGEDDRFLSPYDGRQWTELVARPGASSAVVYAMGQVGLALYPCGVMPPRKGLGRSRSLQGRRGGVPRARDRGLRVPERHPRRPGLSPQPGVEDDRRAWTARRVPALRKEKPLPLEFIDGFVRVAAPRLDTFPMIAID